ncbi:prolipoprotein diacylglyceryl transferase [Patescibacteria group bacterium]|nr:prolipoprotein diacylglyceryl transferase [Patescibacteria group bacterium]
MINFLHTYTPDPVLISIGPVNIFWYSFLIITAVILALVVVSQLGKKYQIKTDQIIDIGFYTIIFGILGARLFYVLLEIDYYFFHPLDIFKVWQGGLAIHGAIIAGIIVVYIYAKKNKQSFWLWLDISAPAVALGQAIGRWGNYFNQELYGKPTELAWGISIALKNRMVLYLQYEYFHPTFLYESILDLFIFFTLIILHKRGKSKQGYIFLIYLVLYSVVRFLMEFLRIDPAVSLVGLRWAQIVSILIILISLVVIYKHKLLPVKK